MLDQPTRIFQRSNSPDQIEALVALPLFRVQQVDVDA
jgi:hypothetical protein